MAANELVPCFYSGQNCDVDRPAKIQTRRRCRELKTAKIGRFERHGKVFIFFQRIETALLSMFTGPMSAKNILVFLKTRTDGELLHYEMPHAGDRSIFARHHRPTISVSSRPAFSQPGVQWANYVHA